MKLSIVSVNFNSGELLEATYRSLKSNLSDNVRWIIFDGGSNDGSLTFLSSLEKECLSNILCISEPDDGIYHAMNKAIEIVEPEDFIWFLNAGDLLVSIPRKETLSEDINFFSVRTNQSNQKILTNINYPLSVRTLSPYSSFPHQGLIARSATLKQYKFDEKIGLCADHLQILKLIQHKAYSVSEEAIAIYDVNGISNIRHLEMLKCNCRVCRYLNISVFKYLLINYKYLIKQLLKAIIPREIIQVLRKIK